MAIPKIKLYRLDQSYDPTNDTDIQSVNDDEMYPFAEKSLDLTQYEQLVGTTYRDLMAGRSASGYDVEILMFNNGTSEAPSYDKFKSALQNCDGWRLDDIKVKLSTDGGSTYTNALPEKYYRLIFTTSPIFDDESNPTWKRQARYVQVELGKWIYSAANEEIIGFIPTPNSNPVNKIKLEYSLFSDDITSSLGVGDTLSLQNGHIYDGTHYGRKSVVKTGIPVPISDDNNVPLKTEGNIGYKIKTYPCRQKVAYFGSDAIGTVPSGASWVKDLNISADGKIIVTDCQNWIISQTDDRRPRLFQRLDVIGEGGSHYSSYLELEQGVQYSSSLTTDSNGNFNLIFQLSSEYYNVSYGVYVFPTELFIRFNEEEDILEDIFQPNYLDLTLDGDIASGTWSKSDGTDTADLTASESYSSIGRREFKMAVTSEGGYVSGGDDLELEWSGDSFSISLPEGVYDGITNTVMAWENGVLIYDKGSIPSEEERKYYSPSLTTSSFSMTLTDSAVAASVDKPMSILISYVKSYSLSNQKVVATTTYSLTSDQTFQENKQYFTQSGSSYVEATVTPGDSIPDNTYFEENNTYENPWAVGWRICAYEKTKTANLFISSFRNWVSDHLNNSPDVFQGFTEYDGSMTNQTGINYISGGFSILHRNGAVSFSSPVSQLDFIDVINNYSNSISVNYQNISYEELKMYINLVYSKFAYYDGIQDINNGLLRKIAVGSNFYSYKLLDDPTYVTDENPRYSGDSDTISRTTFKNKRWIVRNDSKMPTIFYKDNDYLPSSVYSTEAYASKWEPDQVKDEMFLQINVSSYRSVFVINGIDSPAVEGTEIGGQTNIKYANIAWNSTYSGDTELKNEPESNSIIFPVKCVFVFDSSIGRWRIQNTTIQVFHLTDDVSAVPLKEYFTYSSLTFSYSKVNSPINPKSNGYFEKQEINFSSRDLTTEDSTKSILEIMKLKEKIIYSTNIICPYNLIFLCGENGLVISAKSK